MGGKPLTNAQTWGVYDGFLSDERVHAFAEAPQDALFRRYSSVAQASPKIWADAYLLGHAAASDAVVGHLRPGIHQLRSAMPDSAVKVNDPAPVLLLSCSLTVDLPAAPATLMLHLGELAGAEKKISTLTRRVAAIAQIHRVAGFEVPGEARAVRDLLSGVQWPTRDVSFEDPDPVTFPNGGLEHDCWVLPPTAVCICWFWNVRENFRYLRSLAATWEPRGYMTHRRPPSVTEPHRLPAAENSLLPIRQTRTSDPHGTQSHCNRCRSA